MSQETIKYLIEVLTDDGPKLRQITLAQLEDAACGERTPNGYCGIFSYPERCQPSPGICFFGSLDKAFLDERH